MKKIKLFNEPNLITKYDSFPYQKEAVDAIKDKEYAGIFHEQGLGKTKIAIDLLLYWLEYTDIDTVIISTKKQLVQNWVNEFAMHTYIKPMVITSNSSSNFYAFTSGTRVIITNFEAVKSEKNRFELFVKTRNVAIIIDESAKLKNPESELTKVYFELSTSFKKRVIMTGTPVANRPYDIWAQIFFLDHGKSLGKDFKRFKSSTDLSNNLSNDNSKQKELENVLSVIYKKIAGFSVRETKKSGIVTLPEKKYIRVETDFELEQYKLYKKICNDMIVEIEKGGTSLLDDSSANVKRLLRLLQVSSNPFLVNEKYYLRSGKLEKLEELIDNIIKNEEKCIVWTCFIENVEYFNHIFSRYGCVKIHGKMTIADRNKSLEKFRNKEYKILFATPASAKEGLTLTMANHVIFYDRGFSLDDYLQAQDRIHRISQDKVCYIYNIIMRNSIDEWIDVLLGAKENAASLVQGDITLAQYRKQIDYCYGDIVKGILYPDGGKSDE